MTDGAGEYGTRETCRVVALRPFYVYTTQYDVERTSSGRAYDFLTVNGAEYKYSPPNGVKMGKGAALQWYSDGSGSGAGWKVCAEESGTEHA